MSQEFFTKRIWHNTESEPERSLKLSRAPAKNGNVTATPSRCLWISGNSLLSQLPSRKASKKSLAHGLAKCLETLQVLSRVASSHGPTSATTIVAKFRNDFVPLCTGIRGIYCMRFMGFMGVNITWAMKRDGSMQWVRCGQRKHLPGCSGTPNVSMNRFGAIRKTSKACRIPKLCLRVSELLDFKTIL